jgi:hypothetical protein
MKQRLHVGFGCALLGALGCAGPSVAKFASPEAAMRAVVDAAETGDSASAENLFGADGIELLRSGDPVSDREDAQRVKEAATQKLAFEERDADTVVALLGDDAWPFASTGRDGHPPAFARRMISSEGKHDGLYWPAAPTETESPLGEFVAYAAYEGYTRKDGEPTPYHGYYFRSLERQGAPDAQRLRPDRLARQVRQLRRDDLPGRAQRDRVRARPRAGHREARRGDPSLRRRRNLDADRRLIRRIRFERCQSLLPTASQP